MNSTKTRTGADGAEEGGRVIAYMDGVDWQHEIGRAAGGSAVYATAEDCEKHRVCARECGVVEVEVRFRRWVREQRGFEGEEQPNRLSRAGKEG